MKRAWQFRLNMIAGQTPEINTLYLGWKRKEHRQYVSPLWAVRGGPGPHNRRPIPGTPSNTNMVSYTWKPATYSDFPWPSTESTGAFRKLNLAQDFDAFLSRFWSSHSPSVSSETQELFTRLKMKSTNGWATHVGFLFVTAKIRWKSKGRTW